MAVICTLRHQNIIIVSKGNTLTPNCHDKEKRCIQWIHLFNGAFETSHAFNLAMSPMVTLPALLPARPSKSQLLQTLIKGLAGYAELLRNQ